MQSFLEALYSLLIPQVVAALIGGFIGASSNIKVELYGWRLSLLTAFGSLIAAGALAEYLTYNHDIQFILLHCVLGILVGILGNSLLNSINASAPKFTQDIVDALSYGLIEIVKEIPKLIIRKLEEIFYWFKIIIKRKNDNE